MTPPPPSRTTNKASLSTSASDLAEEFDSVNFFPGISPPSNPQNLKARQVKKGSTSATTLGSNASNSSSNSSLANSSSVSNISSFSFSDDFTLGSRTNTNAINANSVTKTAHYHHQTQHHYHHQQFSTSRRASHPHNYNRHTSSKERFVFSNFRFLVKESAPFPNSVDEPFDWLSIEMVLVPEIENVLCPVCLDVPCIPRFTRCGHIYCMPCLLQFFQTSEPSLEGLGNNWRSCPVCAEPLHLKQLRPVKFCPATEPKEGEIFHSLLIQKTVGSLRPHLPKFANDTISSLSPFQRLIPVSKSFVLNEIITPDINLLRSEIKNRKLFGEESLELSFFEAAIKLLEDQRKFLLEDKDDASSPKITDSKNTKKSTGCLNASTSQECYYFHQSRDGLNVFLHPLSMKILKHHFNSYNSIPCDLSLPIIQLERVLVSSSNRKRFKYLDHLSLGTQIILVEVDLRSIVSNSTLHTHSKELSNRQDARDQKLAQSAPSLRDRSILEEWKMMEDDYYSISQVTAAMDIKVPESVKLDNLDDEASFPLPSSFNGTISTAGSIPIKATSGYKKTPPIGTSVGSPSFSALAHSLNSPFTFSSTIDFSNDALITSSSPSNPPSWVSPQTPESANAVSGPASTDNLPNLSTAATATTTSSNSKKKIVLFSSGLNVKQR